MTFNWEYSSIDEIINNKLKDFLPKRVFDSHAHLYRLSDLNINENTFLSEGPKESGFNVWKEHISKIVKGAELCGGLFFPMVSHNCDIGSSNSFLLEQLELSTNNRGLILISPDSQTMKIEEYLMNPRIIGFKPYFYFSRERPIEESSILSFLPEWIWELAHSRKLTIMLHIVKRKALADHENQDVLCRMCRKYNGVKLILAHAARGFNAQNTIDGLEILKELDNIWFDSSAICETKSLKAVLKCFGSGKLLWGTDFPDSHIRGKCVSVGDGFAWLDNTNVNWEKLFPSCNPVLFGIESLLALNEVADDLELNEDDIKNIFIENALKLFGIGN